MATDTQAKNMGFAIPLGTDNPRLGDDAIRQNARATVDAFVTATDYAYQTAHWAVSTSDAHLLAGLQSVTGELDHGTVTGPSLVLDAAFGVHVMDLAGPTKITGAPYVPDGARLIVVIRSGGRHADIAPDAWANGTPAYIGDAALVELRRVRSKWLGVSQTFDAPQSGDVETAIAQAGEALPLARDAIAKATAAYQRDDAATAQHITDGALTTAAGDARWVRRRAGVRVDVADYGARGDGTSDDTAAINAAIAALPGTATFGGATLEFPQGTYRVTSALKPIVTAGVTIEAAGMARIVPDSGVTGTLMQCTGSDVRVAGLRFSMNGAGADALSVTGAGLACLDRVTVDGLTGSATGVTVQAPSGRLVATGCTISGAPTHTGIAWRLDGVRDAVLVACAGSSGGLGKGVAWAVRDARDVRLIGASATSAGIGFALDASLAITGLVIDAPALDSLTYALTTSGTAGIIGLDLRAPSVRASVGPITLAAVTGATLTTRSLGVTIAASCTGIRVVTDDLAKITDSANSSLTEHRGVFTTQQRVVLASTYPAVNWTVPGRPQSWRMEWNATASSDSGFRFKYYPEASTEHLLDYIAAGATQRSFSLLNGAGVATETLRLTRDPATSFTAMQLLVNRTGTPALLPVSVGAPDSGGSGYRALRVAN